MPRDVSRGFKVTLARVGGVPRPASFGRSRATPCFDILTCEERQRLSPASTISSAPHKNYCLSTYPSSLITAMSLKDGAYDPP